VSLSQAFDLYLPLIEAELQDIVRAPHHSRAVYYGMMRYHMGWLDEDLDPVEVRSGKRLRPMLCLLACQAAGGDPEQALPAAAALELVHNFSLVHDDIQDVSHHRRGRLAVWDIWGMAQGIYVGDGLFVLARLALHRLGERGVSLARQQAATLALDRACLALCEGQFFDMTFEEQLDTDLEQYLWMIDHKTAALLATSAQMGAIVASDDPQVIDHFRSFGRNLGIAFQIQDDILGAWGDERVTGKSAATDIRDKKKALPATYTLNQTSNAGAAQRLARLYAQEGPLDQEGIEAGLTILGEVGARAHCEEMAQEYHDRALDSLDSTRIENTALAHMRQLAASLLGRQT
jgi:geranylgeranyl diphosphate synthase type I